MKADSAVPVDAAGLLFVNPALLKAGAGAETAIGLPPDSQPVAFPLVLRGSPATNLRGSAASIEWGAGRVDGLLWLLASALVSGCCGQRAARRIRRSRHRHAACDLHLHCTIAAVC